MLGPSIGETTTTERLVAAACSHWSKDELTVFEEAIRAYRPAVPDDLTDPEQRRTWTTMIRLTRLALLRALPKNRLNAKARRHVEEEERAFPDARRRVRMVGPYWVGSIMSASEIGRASDADVISVRPRTPNRLKVNWVCPD